MTDESLSLIELSPEREVSVDENVQRHSFRSNNTESKESPLQPDASVHK